MSFQYSAKLYYFFIGALLKIYMEISRGCFRLAVWLQLLTHFLYLRTIISTLQYLKFIIILVEIIALLVKVLKYKKKLFLKILNYLRDPR